MPNYNRLQKLSLALVETNIVVIIDTIVFFLITISIAIFLFSI